LIVGMQRSETQTTKKSLFPNHVTAESIIIFLIMSTLKMSIWMQSQLSSFKNIKISYKKTLALMID
jgi:hypothetical protein